MCAGRPLEMCSWLTGDTRKYAAVLLWNSFVLMGFPKSIRLQVVAVRGAKVASPRTPNKLCASAAHEKAKL